MTPRRWRIAAPERALSRRLAEELGLPLPLAQVLTGRGLGSPDAARTFLHPRLQDLADPFELPDMAAAVDGLLSALTNQRRIVIYGDYDVDGLTASALLGSVLRAAGATVEIFLPHRLDEGYGLSAEGLARCLAEHRPDLLVAVDCGTSSASEIAGLNRQGVRVIVVDHHEPPPELPECVALVNPKVGQPSRLSLDQQQEKRDARSTVALASVGVAFKLTHALLKRARDLGLAWASEIDLREHLDLVAIGTVADVVPLTGENRILVKAGLTRLPGTRRVGLQALMELAGVPRERPLSPSHIGFRIGPRLNAAGRLGDARAALELLLTDDAATARRLAELLHASNARRQRVEEDILRQARQMAAEEVDLERDRVVVLAGAGWHAGVIGIIASRILQDCYRPTVVIGIEDGVGKGSCRSIPGFSIVAALDRCAPLLERFGGHEMAAGLSVKEENIPSLRRALNEVARRQLSDADLMPRVDIDAEVGLGQLDDEFFEHLERFEPCGPDNPTPIFAVRGVSLPAAPRMIGKNHLKFRVSDGKEVVDAVWWGAAGEQLPRGLLEIAFSPEINDYRGVETIQLRVRDVRPSEGENARADG